MHINQDLDGFLPYQSTAVGFHPRLDFRNWAACGLFALHHAMVFLGQGGSYSLLRDEHPSFYSKIHGGTITHDLLRLAKKMALRATHFETPSLKTFRKHLDKTLQSGTPVIIGSEPAVHWICLGGRSESGGYVWADSADPSSAIGAFETWDDVEQWLTCDEGSPVDLNEHFSAITIQPNPKMPAGRSLVPWMGSLYSSLSADPHYAMDWSNLLADMLDVFWDKEYAPKGIPAGDFLECHLEGIVQATRSLTGHGHAAVMDCANAYRDAADFHSLVVDRGQDAWSIAAFAHKLAAKVRISLG